MNDLRTIRSYYTAFGTDTVDRVLDDIEHALTLVRQHPQAGPLMQGRPFRRILTRRYRFKIAYIATPGLIDILGVFRFQNRDR